jgi:hypothetical protein
MAGDIVLTFAADDGRPAADTITLTITILPGNSPPQVGTPTGPGTVGGADPAYVATVPGASPPSRPGSSRPSPSPRAGHRPSPSPSPA